MCVFLPTSGMQPEKAVASRSHLRMLPEPALNGGTEPAVHSQASEITWIRLAAADFIAKNDLSRVPAVQLLMSRREAAEGSYPFSSEA